MITTKFYSDMLKREFATEKEAVAAEKAYEKTLKEAEAKRLEAQKKQEALKAQRAERAKEVENAFKEATNARNHANTLLNEFIKDYGSFHATVVDRHPITTNFDFLDNFLSMLFPEI